MINLILVLSVGIGILIVKLLNSGQNKKNIKLLLSFSGAYLFAISVLHLIPEIYEGNDHHIGLFILIGFFAQIVLEFFSKGIEHGHGHLHKGSIPITMLMSLCLHAFLEGIPLGSESQHHAHHDHNIESVLLAGIALHKIPVSIVLFTLFRGAGLSNTRSYLLMFFFAIMTPLGNYVGTIGSDFYNREIMGIVVGIFLHISTTILFESSEGHRFNIMKLISIIAGTLVAWFGLH
mgnify:CR=1 FL=1